MTNWTKLKKSIADVIKTNGNQEITGAIMQQTLMSIVDNVGGNAQFGGVAVPSTVPADTDGSVFYLASTQGTYPNFSGIKVDASEMAVFTKNTARTWVKTSLPIQHPTIKKPLLIGGNVAAVTKGTGVVLSVPTLNADGTETVSELSIEAATPANNGAMTKEQVNTLKEVDGFYTRMTDFVVGDNDDRTLINIETTKQDSISLKYKSLDVVSGSQVEKTKAIPAVSPMNGTAGVAGMNLVHDIPYFFDFYNTNFISLPDGSDITNILIPKFRTSYDGFDNLYTNVPAIQNKVFANPKAGDRILIGSLSGAPVGSAPLWATVTSAQRINGVYSVTVEYDGDTYIFAYTSSNDIATLKVPWSKVSPKRNVYTNYLKRLNPEYDEALIRDYLTPQVYRKYNIVYPVKPQTGDLIGESRIENERYVAIKTVRNEENPNEYTDILIPEYGTANAYTRIVLKNDLSAVKSRNPYYILRTSKRAYKGNVLLALDTVKAETIVNSISDAYSFTIDERNTGLAAQLPEVGDLIKMQGDDGGDSAPVCEIFFTGGDVQHTRWFCKGKLYEVTVNTALTRVPEDPKVIYDTTSGTLRDLYVSAGAVYNEQTGYYELNGLTDITEEQMREIWQENLSGWYLNGRTNLTENIEIRGLAGGYNDGIDICSICYNNSNITKFNFGASLYARYVDNAFSGCTKLETIDTRFPIIPFGGIVGPNTFRNCPALKEVRFNMRHLQWSTNVNFPASSLISKDSILSVIQTTPTTGSVKPLVVVGLNESAYNRLKDDTDITAALTEKNGFVTLTQI